MSSIRQLVQSAAADDRRAMLQELVDALSLQDRCALSSLISTKNDPFARFPTELIIRLLDDLPLFDAWRLQLVCRSWQSVLSSDTIQRAVLARWETHDSADSARAPDWSAQQSIVDKLRHVQAWRLGLPFSTAEIPKAFASHEGRHIDRPFRTQAYRTLALQGSRIAYLDSDSHRGDTLVVRDLVNDEPDHRLIPEGRERIMGIVLTSKLVAYLTFAARLYVQTLPAAPECSKTIRVIRLPSASASAFHADGDLVGVVIAQSGEGQPSLLLYNHATGRLAQHSVPRPHSVATTRGDQSSLASSDDQQEADEEDNATRKGPSSMLVNERTGITDLFYGSCIRRDRHSPYLLWLAHQRYYGDFEKLEKYDDRSQPKKETLSSPTHAWSTSEQWYRRNDGGMILAWPTATGKQGHWSFDVHVVEEDLHKRQRNCVVPLFDATTGFLQLKRYSMPWTNADVWSGPLSLWKDVIQLSSIARIHVPLFNAHEESDGSSRLEIRPTTLCGPTRRLCNRHWDIVQNDSFMVAACYRSDTMSDTYLSVWCFETDLDWKMDAKTQFADLSLDEMSGRNPFET